MLNKRFRQVASLYISMVIGLFIGICISILNTRLLGPKIYGDLKFIQSIFTLILPVMTLGIFVTGSKLLAHTRQQEVKIQLSSCLLIIAAIISVVFIIFLYTLSFFQEYLFENNLGHIIRVVSPFLFVYPFQICFENILQGENRIYELSILRLSPSFLYLSLALLFTIYFKFSLISALSLQLISMTLILIILILKAEHSFTNLKNNIKTIWEENKSYGIKVYFGIIFGVVSGNLGALSIGYFLDTTQVGFYSLAVIISKPLTMIPNTVGTTFFRDFSRSNYISKNIIVVTFSLSLIALSIIFISIKKIVLLLYTEYYIDTVELVYFVSIGSLAHGFGDFFNRFLGAHGKGRELRNGAIMTGSTNIFGFFFLVYFFGSRGAALTKLISGAVYCFSMFYFYLRYRNIVSISRL